MNLRHHDTPSPIVISLNHVVITTKHGTYPVHRHWFDTTPLCEHRAERDRLQRIANLMKRRTVRISGAAA